MEKEEGNDRRVRELEGLFKDNAAIEFAIDVGITWRNYKHYTEKNPGFGWYASNNYRIRSHRQFHKAQRDRRGRPPNPDYGFQD